MITISKDIIVTDIESVVKYINEIKNIPILNKDEEYQLFLRIQKGDVLWRLSHWFFDNS